MRDRSLDRKPPKKVLSFEEIEKEAMEEAKKNKFRARPMPTSTRPTKPKSASATPTMVESLSNSVSAPSSKWHRYWSPKRNSWFLFDEVTEQIFWEGRRVGAHHEEFMTPGGKTFYLNNITNRASLEGPAYLCRKRDEAIAQFQALDRDGNGLLDLEEVITGAELLKLSKAEARRWFREIDTNRNGQVSVLEFLDKYRRMTTSFNVSGYSSREKTYLSAENGEGSQKDMLRLTNENNSKSNILMTKEQRNKKDVKRRICMADPHSSPRIAWDILLIIPLLIYLSIVLPFKLCTGFQNRSLSPMDIIEISIDIVFMMDIILNFRTGVIDEHDNVIYDADKVAMNYLRSWFLLDFVSGLPFTLLDSLGVLSLKSFSALKSSRVLKALRIVRFLKLTRLLKGAKFFSRMDPDNLDFVEDFFADPLFRSLSRMLGIAFAISYTTHLAACFWILVGRLSDMADEDLDAEELSGDIGSARNGGNGRYYWRHPDASNWLMMQGFTHDDCTRQRFIYAIYHSAYYFCLTTMTSVGFGDIFPYNDMERSYVIVLEAVGGFVYAMVIASLTSIVSAMDSNARRVSEKIDVVSVYIENRQFPRSLGRRLRRHFRHFYSQKSAVDEQQILRDLSVGLRREVSSFLLSGIMHQVSMFKALPRHLWSKVLPLLRPTRFEIGEKLSDQGEMCSEMYLVLEGSMHGETFVGREELHAREMALVAERKADAKALGLAVGDSIPVLVAKMGSSEQEVDRSSKTDEVPREQRVRLGRSFSEGTSVTSTGGQVSRQASKLFVGLHSQKQKHKNVPSQGDDGYSKIIHSAKGDTYVRRIVAGDTINPLCVLRVWDRSVESVYAEDTTHCYAINAENFISEFRDELGLLEQMRERTIETQFHMVDDFEAPTEFGVPLFTIPKAKSKRLEEEYEKHLAEKNQEIKRVKLAARTSSIAAGGTRAGGTRRPSGSSSLSTDVPAPQSNGQLGSAI